MHRVAEVDFASHINLDADVFAVGVISPYSTAASVLWQEQRVILRAEQSLDVSQRLVALRRLRRRHQQTALTATPDGDRWAREAGRQVSDRGRIPADITKAFANAHHGLAAVG